MLILGLLGMYFDAAVVFVTKSSLFFRLAVAILCKVSEKYQFLIFKIIRLPIIDLYLIHYELMTTTIFGNTMSFMNIKIDNLRWYRCSQYSSLFKF